MILQCPSCENRYLVDPRALGETGRTVRCAKCRHQWFAEAATQQPAPDVLPAAHEEVERPRPRPIPEGSSVPALAPQRREVPQMLQYAAVAALVLFLSTAFIHFRPQLVAALPGLQGSYAALGLYDTDGVIFAGLEYAQTKGVSKDSHRISGYVVNTADAPRRLPMIGVSLFSEDGKRMRHTRIYEHRMMAAGEEQHFSREVMTSPESARRVELELGSPFALRLR